MGKHITPEGWNNWGNPANEQTTFYAEYKNSSAGADITNRAKWSHQLNDKEAVNYSRWLPFSTMKALHYRLMPNGIASKQPGRFNGLRRSRLIKVVKEGEW